MKRSISLYVVLALLLSWAPMAFAQETRGSVEGVVKDSSGAVLPGVTVEARTGSGGVITAVSDDAGKYRFPSLPPGRYTITANMQGFKKRRSRTSTCCSARCCSSTSRWRSAA